MVQPTSKRLVTEAALVDPASPAGAALAARFVRGDLTGVEDGDGLVYDAGLGKYVPGAAGDEGLAARVTTLEETAPTVEEFETGRVLSTVSTATTAALSVANLAQRIGSLAVASATAIAQSDTDYWTVSLVRYREGIASTIVSRTTKATDGAAVAAFVEWNFDLRTWGGFLRHIRKGDVLGIVFAPTGAPGPWTAPVVTWRYEPGVLPSVTILASDSFNRADSTLTLGTADSGQTWQSVVRAGTTTAVWGISNGQAYTPAAYSAGGAVLDVGTPDGTMEVTYAVKEAGTGIFLRTIDGDNGLFMDGNLALFSRNAAAQTAVGTFSGVAPVSGDVITVVLNGTSITLKVNGVTRSTLTTSAFQTATKFGIRASSSTASRFENFSFVGLG